MVAPIIVASSSFVKHLVPITLGRSIELSVPKVRHYFYFDVLKALNTESKVPPNPIIPCTAPKMPHFREEFLRPEKFCKLNVLEGYETYGKEFQELIINSEGRSHFNAERWPDWIRKTYTKNKNQFLKTDVLTEYGALRPLLVHPFLVGHIGEKGPQVSVSIVGQKVNGVIFLYRIVNVKKKKSYTDEDFKKIYSGLRFRQLVLERHEDFIRDDPYSLAPYGVFEIEIGKHLDDKKAKKAYRLTYFKSDMCLDKSGPIQLYTDKMYSTFKVTDSNWVNKLINYLDLRLMGTTRAIVGHKDVNKDPFNVEKFVSYEFPDFQSLLHDYLQEEYLLAGAVFAYKFIDKNVQLLRDHPEGYWTSCNLTTHDREATIQLNKFEDRIAKYVPASFAKLREEYRLD